MKKFSYALADIALVAAAIAAAMGMVMIGLWIAGYPAGRVMAQWWIGAVGSHFAFVVATKNACPLILTGLAAGIAFRSGVFNIGAEGQSILGAIATVWIATRLCPQINSMTVAIPMALLGAMIFGGLWGMVAGALERWRGVPIVLSTILLNFIALQLLSLLLEGPLKTGRTAVMQSDALPTAYWLPILTRFGDLRSGVLIALAAAALTWLLQARTAFGFELLVTGLNPTAARLAGMPVARRQLGVMVLSGALAGLAGAIQVMGVEGHFLGTAPASYGYAGIAVALLGRLHPLGIVLAALFFGFLDQGATTVEISRYALPHEVADIVKGLIVLMILVGTAYISRMRTTARER
jgi:general nucleoside transport system permease protein